jgi:hypothetical protein
MKKTFRGLVADDTSTKIRLSTNDGLTGYKINKFQIISPSPGTNTCELVCKVFSTPHAVSGTVNFDDPTLLGVSYFAIASASFNIVNEVIFDSMTVNQDIHLTMKDNSGNNISGNYYLELEQVKLDLNEATVATLKDMRGRE